LRSVLHCNPWPVSLYHIFPNYLIFGTILGKKVLKCFDFLYNVCLKRFSF